MLNLLLSLLLSPGVQDTRPASVPASRSALADDLLPIADLVRQAGSQWQAGQWVPARATVQKAWQAVGAVAGAEARDDVRQLLHQIGRAAHQTGDAATEELVWSALLRRLEGRRAGDPEVHAVRIRLAGALKFQIKLPAAREQEELAVKAAEPPGGPGGRALWSARCSLAATLLMQQQDAPARELLERTVPLLSGVSTAQDLDFQMARMNLATVRRRQHDIPGALELYQQVHDVLAATLQPGDLALLQAQANLAETRFAAGEREEGLRLERQVFETSEKTLPIRHPFRRTVRRELVGMFQAAGEPRKALRVLEQAYRSDMEGLPRDDQGLDATRTQLAIALRGAGEARDLRVARGLFEQCLATALRCGSPDGTDVQHARVNLAALLLDLRELTLARDLFGQAHASCLRTPDCDALLWKRVREGLALCLLDLGEASQGAALMDQALAAYASARPPDDPELQRTRLNAAQFKSRMGDIPGALLICEQAVAAYSAKAPDDPERLRAGYALAAVKLKTGDLTGGLALASRVLAVQEQALPPTHPERLKTRLLVADLAIRLGDLAVGLSHAEAVLAARRDVFGAGHPEVLHACEFTAWACLLLGDPSGALERLESVRGAWAARGPESAKVRDVEHKIALVHIALGRYPEAIPVLEREIAERTAAGDGDERLWRTRATLALAQLHAGHLARAAELLDGVRGLGPLASLGWFDVSEHGTLLLWARLALGQKHQVPELVRDLTRACRQLASESGLAARAVGAAISARPWVLDAPLSAVVGCATTPAQPELAAEVLLAAECLRDTELRRARLARTTLTSPRAAAELKAATQRFSGAAADAAALIRAELSAAERKDKLLAAIGARDQAEQALAGLAAALGSRDIRRLTLAELAGALPAGAAAATLVRFDHYEFLAAGRTITPRLAALVLQPAGRVVAVLLPPLAQLEPLVEQARRMFQSQVVPSRRGSGERDPLVKLKELRRAVLDPVRAQIPGATVLYLSVDSCLALLPLDALPLEDDQPLGSELSLRDLPSLLELMEPPQVAAGNAGLLALGDLEYDAAPKAGGPVWDSQAAAPALSLRAGEPGRFAALGQTRQEVADIAQLFRTAFPGASADVVTGAEGDRARLWQGAQKARYLHLATHGFFAPEAIRSAADRVPGLAVGLRIEEAQTATGLSPLVLTGLALAGANQPPDASGRHPGIVTAEELLSLDLSQCQLAVLSACNTSLGVRRAGLGYASLRAALLGAGARAVVTSLWEVPDEKTAELMAAFYRRLWRDKVDPHRALWQAKMAIRDKANNLRDWAGWVLTGR